MWLPKTNAIVRQLVASHPLLVVVDRVEEAVLVHRSGRPNSCKQAMIHNKSIMPTQFTTRARRERCLYLPANQLRTLAWWLMLIARSTASQEGWLLLLLLPTIKANIRIVGFCVFVVLVI